MPPKPTKLECSRCNEGIQPFCPIVMRQSSYVNAIKICFYNEDIIQFTRNLSKANSKIFFKDST
ncbi:MAG: hypothetical protein ACFFCI_15290 [Promethearchaeota archaeon]